MKKCVNRFAHLVDCAIERGFEYLLIWIGCVFGSILIHEMGHVFMGQVFGAQGTIVLYSLGGLAIGSSNLPSRWQRIAVSFAGPGLFGSNVSGMLSTQKYPKSSNALTADDIPEPLRPVMITISGAFG